MYLNQPSNGTIPYILDNTTGQERVWDLWSRMNKDRIVFLGEDVNDHSANLIVAQLLYLEATNKEEDIYLYINSPGGYITSGLAIYDVMQYIKPAVHTICFGQAASMGAMLLAAGAKGHRYCLPNSSIMIHQPRGGANYGQATDVFIQVERLKKVKERMAELMAKHTGKTFKKVLADTERDNWLTPEEALEYGIVDTILTRRDED